MNQTQILENYLSFSLLPENPDDWGIADFSCSFCIN